MAPGTSPRHNGSRWGAFALPLALLAACVYVPLLHVPFVADDYANLLHPGNFVAPAAPLFRPVETLLLTAFRRAFGEHPLPWHLASVMWHVAAVLLVFRVFAQLFARNQPDAGSARAPVPEASAALAAALFAVTPRAVQAVIWPSAISDLAYAVCVLAGLAHWLAIRPSGSGVTLRGGLATPDADARRPDNTPHLVQRVEHMTGEATPTGDGHAWAAALWYLLGLCSKEAAVILPVLCVGTDLIVDRRIRLRPLLPQTLVAVIYGLFQWQRPALLARLPWHPPFLPDITGGYGFVGWPALGRHLLVYPTLAVLPWVHQTWGYHWAHDALLALPVYALLVRWTMCGGIRRFGALWVLATSAPAMVFAPFDVSDLYLYVPVLGTCLAVAAEAAELARHRRTALAAGLAACLAMAQVVPLVHDEAAWRVDTAAFLRARATILQTALAHPDATLVLRGLPAFDGEVYLFMDAFPYLTQLLAPSFRGRVLLGRRTPKGALVLTFAPDGALVRNPRPG